MWGENLLARVQRHTLSGELIRGASHSDYPREIIYDKTKSTQQSAMTMVNDQ
jgi:hypothetical protein